MSRSQRSGFSSREAAHRLGRLTPALLACLLVGVPLTEAVAEAAEQAPEKASKTLRKRVVVKQGEDDTAVPNGALGSHDPETIDAVRERWEHLRATINRSHPFNPDGAEVAAADVRPWAPPTDTGSVRGASGILLGSSGSPSSVAPNGFSSTVNEPSVAAVGDYVFYTANWYAAASTDGGSSWSFVNPHTGPFAEPADQSFCCDQQVHHDPASNTIFWLQQMIPASATAAGTQRVNVDRQSDGSWDCYYDLTPQDADFADSTYPDYPDFSVSDGHLFVTSNVFASGSGDFQGAFVARLPLAKVTACSDAMVDFHTETDFGSFRTTQGAGETMYFATLDSDQSIRVWSWPDASAAPTAVSRPVNAFFFGTRNCADPSGTNWCGFLDSRLMGAAVSGDRAAFLWVAEENPAGGFPFPYTQGVVLDTSDDLAVLEQPLIWSNDAAWIYPSLAANSQGGFGGTVLWGGGTFFPRCSAFLIDGENSHSWAPLEHEVVLSGAGHAGGNRSGDYLSTRAYSSNDKVYAGSCFAYPENGVGESRYVLFGRADDFLGPEIFADGFEGGGVGAWSTSLP